MTHVDEDFLRVPARLVLPVAEEDVGKPVEIKLPIKGQGTIGFAIADAQPFSIIFQSDLSGAPVFRWTVDRAGVTLHQGSEGGWDKLDLHISTKESLIGIDPEILCPYWFSFDCHNRALIYGKGEMRRGTSIARHDLPAKPTQEGAEDPYAWIREVVSAEVTAPIRDQANIWRDPVTSEPPMLVITHDQMTMEDAAAGEVTVPANLTPTCQKLYDNVAGANFLLDTPDFPDFSRAIRRSIEDPNGWCRKTLDKKAKEFGDDPHEVYLRITLGINQGESPGIPYVMEIWPAGCYSPIHNHGGSDAVIRVLHGQIWVHLFSMLSEHHQTAFRVATFREGDVTWISARLNQVHQLRNYATDGEPCITIQCYLYEENDQVHWPYFDYLGKSEIAHFDPNSDASFAEFQAIMRKEWETAQALSLDV